MRQAAQTEELTFCYLFSLRRLLMRMFGTSQATILALFFGRDDIPYQSTWAGAGGATRSYAGFHQMANEQGRSRVYGGIHFEFDQIAGQSAGRNVANYVFLNFMKPRCNN